MPRVLDTAARDAAVIQAAWHVIAREGITALTVRRVAAQAGLAPSSLRYTFPTQAAVREKAITAVSQRLSQRIAALPADLTAQAWARAALLELLPLDQQRSLEMEVFLALGMAALTDDSLQPLWQQADTVVRDVCTKAITAAGGEPTAVQVDRLHALIDGLAFHLLVRDRTRGHDWAQHVVDRELRSLAARRL
ncbi:TetR family transcriptional regulator C-terminal domain-containing protein [Actinoplanes sp. NPDC024001]|uniref:TetR/AcrR family transcriptional regulator n=1 Tax=Actinoplanes sp. NPDC024001 TaxID=3154598 RepID=UPI0033E4D5CE